MYTSMLRKRDLQCSRFSCGVLSFIYLFIFFILIYFWGFIFLQFFFKFFICFINFFIFINIYIYVYLLFYLFNYLLFGRGRKFQVLISNVMEKWTLQNNTGCFFIAMNIIWCASCYKLHPVVRRK